MVVIPCYNEEHRLRVDAVDQALDAQPDLDLILVNDGSADGTSRLLARLAAIHPGRIAALDLPRNRGKGEAVRAGMRSACASGARYVGFWDADLATPLDDVAVFARILEDHPALLTVFGSRVKLMGRRIRRSEVRHYLGRVFATMVSVSLRAAVYDTQCGAKLFRAGPLLDAVLEEPFTSRWIFDVELLARLNRLHRAGQAPPLHALLYEYPLMRWEDVRGSKVSIADFPRSALDLLLIHFRYLA